LCASSILATERIFSLFPSPGKSGKRTEEDEGGSDLVLCCLYANSKEQGLTPLLLTERIGFAFDRVGVLKVSGETADLYR